MFLCKLFTVLYCTQWLVGVTCPPVILEGPCKPLSDCPQLSQLIKTRRDHYGTKTILRLLKCNNSYLKCVDQSAIDTFMSKADVLTGQEDCGLQESVNKIYGGEQADLYDFPWIALLKYKNQRSNFTYGCHGNLLSDKYLLTAAHCLDPNSPKVKFVGNLVSVILGEYDIRNESDCIYYPNDPECAEPVKEYFVQGFQLHPHYNAASQDNDIALIRVKDRIQFTDFIRAICLPPNNAILSPNETYWIGGWGETKDNKMNNVKMKAKFSTRGADSISTYRQLTDKQLCVGSVDTKARTCPGDSGGPLMTWRQIGQNTHYYLIGVNSLGVSCSNSLRISVYTKVPVYIEWIINALEV